MIALDWLLYGRLMRPLNYTISPSTTVDVYGCSYSAVWGSVWKNNNDTLAVFLTNGVSNTTESVSIIVDPKVRNSIFRHLDWICRF